MQNSLNRARKILAWSGQCPRMAARQVRLRIEWPPIKGSRHGGVAAQRDRATRSVLFVGPGSSAG
jgi:hypothetical protein